MMKRDVLLRVSIISMIVVTFFLIVEIIILIYNPYSSEMFLEFSGDYQGTVSLNLTESIKTINTNESYSLLNYNKQEKTIEFTSTVDDGYYLFKLYPKRSTYTLEGECDIYSSLSNKLNKTSAEKKLFQEINNLNSNFNISNDVNSDMTISFEGGNRFTNNVCGPFPIICAILMIPLAILGFLKKNTIINRVLHKRNAKLIKFPNTI